MGKTRVLVVEDENIIALDLQTMLRGLGYEVPVTAASGEEAIEKATRHQVDLVLIDIVLRGELDGVDAARIINEVLDLPIVFLTAFSDESTFRRARATAPFAYLLKPVSERELRPTIELALHKHRLEQQLREREQWWSTTLRSIGDAVIATDPRGTVKFMNRAAEELTGWSTGEAKLRAFSEVFQIVSEESRTPLASPVNEVLRKGVPVPMSNGTLLIARDGSECPIADSAAPIVNDRGEVSGVVLVFRDTTSERSAERAMWATTQRLEATLHSLAKAQQQIIRQERLRAIGEMATGIAHDFNNSLSPILGFSDLLLRFPASLDNRERTLHYLKLINTAAADAANVVRRLNDFYRSQTTTTPSAPVDFNLLVEQALLLAQPKWREEALAQGVVVRVEHQPSMIPSIYGEEAELREALLNLIFNATDAILARANSDPAGRRQGVITIRTGRQPRTGGGEDWVALTIQDDGIGMSSEVVKRCQEPFFTTKFKQGAGLGLALVYGTVRRSQGELEIRSTPGIGTTILLLFPPVATSLTATPTSPMLTVAPLQLLFVDDDPTVNEVIRDFLTAAGHSVESATNGQAALERFRHGRFDLVITDKSMPGLTGEQLAVELKALAPEIPVIMLTGYGEIMIASGVRPPAVDVVLGKPVAFDQLIAAMHQLTEQRTPPE